MLRGKSGLLNIRCGRVDRAHYGRDELVAVGSHPNTARHRPSPSWESQAKSGFSAMLAAPDRAGERSVALAYAHVRDTKRRDHRYDVRVPDNVLIFRRRAAPAERATSMNKDEFFADPWSSLRSSDSAIVPTWVGEAWSRRPFRKRATQELVRSVAKNGDFFDASWLLASLGPGQLRREAVIELFVAIRDQAGRPEDEWRGEFEDAFADYVDALPPPQA